MIRHKEVKKSAGEYLAESLQAYKLQEEIEARKDYIDVETGGSLKYLYKISEMIQDLIMELEDKGTILQEDNSYVNNNSVKLIRVLQDIRDKIDKTPVDNIFLKNM